MHLILYYGKSQVYQEIVILVVLIVCLLHLKLMPLAALLDFSSRCFSLSCYLFFILLKSSILHYNEFTLLAGNLLAFTL